MSVCFDCPARTYIGAAVSQYCVAERRLYGIAPVECCIFAYFDRSCLLSQNRSSDLNNQVYRTVCVCQCGWLFTIGNAGNARRYEPLHREKDRSVTTARVRAQQIEHVRESVHCHSLIRANTACIVPVLLQSLPVASNHTFCLPLGELESCCEDLARAVRLVICSTAREGCVLTRKSMLCSPDEVTILLGLMSLMDSLTRRSLGLCRDRIYWLSRILRCTSISIWSTL